MLSGIHARLKRGPGHRRNGRQCRCQIRKSTRLGQPLKIRQPSVCHQATNSTWIKSIKPYDNDAACDWLQLESKAFDQQKQNTNRPRQNRNQQQSQRSKQYEKRTEKRYSRARTNVSLNKETFKTEHRKPLPPKDPTMVIWKYSTGIPSLEVSFD